MFTELNEELLDLPCHREGLPQRAVREQDLPAPGSYAARGSSSSLTCCKLSWN